MFSIDKKETWPHPEFNGDSYDIEIASSYLIVSCSDCAQPQVTLFDRETLDVVKEFDLEAMHY